VTCTGTCDSQKLRGVHDGFCHRSLDGASFVWGNDPAVKQYRELIKFNLNQQVKEMEHTLGEDEGEGGGRAHRIQRRL
jgi:hypothetical protein